jgi:hypothetical protein
MDWDQFRVYHEVEAHKKIHRVEPNEVSDRRQLSEMNAYPVCNKSISRYTMGYSYAL